MGTGIAYVQVRHAGDPAPLVAAICAAASVRGMEISTEGVPDRIVRILPAVGGWVTIHDSEVEGHDEALLETLLRVATASIGAPGLSVVLYSDLLHVAHADARGEIIDRLRQDGGSTKQMLAEISARLGCDPEQVQIDFPGWGVPEGTIELAFRSRERPAWERPATGPIRFRQGPFNSNHRRVELSVGQELRVSFTTTNRGEAGRGVLIAVLGDALDGGLVGVERFELLIGHGRHVKIAPQPARDGALDAEANVEVPVGLPEDVRVMFPDFSRAMDPVAGRHVHVNVVGRALAAGDGALQVVLAPLQNVADGQDGAVVRISVKKD